MAADTIKIYYINKIFEIFVFHLVCHLHNKVNSLLSYVH